MWSLRNKCISKETGLVGRCFFVKDILETNVDSLRIIEAALYVSFGIMFSNLFSHKSGRQKVDLTAYFLLGI